MDNISVRIKNRKSGVDNHNQLSLPMLSLARARCVYACLYVWFVLLSAFVCSEYSKSICVRVRDIVDVEIENVFQFIILLYICMVLNSIVRFVISRVSFHLQGRPTKIHESLKIKMCAIYGKGSGKL